MKATHIGGYLENKSPPSYPVKMLKCLIRVLKINMEVNANEVNASRHLQSMPQGDVVDEVEPRELFAKENERKFMCAVIFPAEGLK